MLLDEIPEGLWEVGFFEKSSRKKILYYQRLISNLRPPTRDVRIWILGIVLILNAHLINFPDFLFDDLRGLYQLGIFIKTLIKMPNFIYKPLTLIPPMGGSIIGFSLEHVFKRGSLYEVISANTKGNNELHMIIIDPPIRG